MNWTQTESARWLAVNGKIEEATEIFKKIGRGNGRDVSDLVIYHKKVQVDESGVSYGSISNHHSNSLIVITDNKYYGV